MDHKLWKKPMESNGMDHGMVWTMQREKTERTKAKIY